MHNTANNQHKYTTLSIDVVVTMLDDLKKDSGIPEVIKGLEVVMLSLGNLLVI